MDSFQPIGSFLTHFALLIMMISVSYSSVSIDTDIDINLIGSNNSFAIFPSWSPCMNGSLYFEFKTRIDSGLLLYLDSKDNDEFIEIKLIGGAAKLRMTLKGQNDITMTASSGLGNGKWHSIEIRRQKNKVQFVLDGMPQNVEQTSKTLCFGSNSNDTSHVYIGGLPSIFKSRLNTLSLPSVVFEPHLRGSMRRLKYSQGNEAKTPYEMIDYHGVRLNNKDYCSENDPCEHSGTCVSTDDSFFCDCTNSRYKGMLCETEETASEATFYGNEFIGYHVLSSGSAVNSNIDQVILRFKTAEANALLFYTGSGPDYMRLWLEDGSIRLRMSLGSDLYETSLGSSVTGLRFDDNIWHLISVTREAREITIAVNNHAPGTGTLFGDFTQLISQVLFVGGSANETITQGTHMFKGCLAEVLYKADNIQLDLLSLGQQNHQFLTVEGNPKYNNCEDLTQMQPVSFHTKESVIEIPDTHFESELSIRFTFKTIESNGVLLYGIGKGSKRDLVLFELFEGTLYFILHIGSARVKMNLNGETDVNEDNQHIIQLQHNGKTGNIDFDGQQHTYRIPGRISALNIEPSIYVGGLKTDEHASRLPRQVYSVVMSNGYMGCVTDVVINSVSIDIAQLARNQITEGVAYQCQAVTSNCANLPCMHHGTCTSGWGRYTCDCSATGFTGSICQRDAATLIFDGKQYMRITLVNETRNEIEDLSLRFRTARTNGLLLVTSSSTTSDRLMLAMDGGRLRLDLKISTFAQTFFVEEGLNNDKWHTIAIQRRQKRLLLQLDEGDKIKQKIVHKAPVIMHIKEILLGSKSTEAVTFSGNQSHSNIKDIVLHHKSDNTSRANYGAPQSFQGQMQSFIFNGRNYFEMVKPQNVTTNKEAFIEGNAEFLQNNDSLTYPITFHTEDAHLVLRYEMKRTFALYFHIRTTQLNGLIFYIGRGLNNDFMAVEIHNGIIRYVYDVGNGPETLVSNLPQKINDNNWHVVSIIHPSLKQHILNVDHSTAVHTMGLDAGSVTLDTNEDFYIGGVTNHIYSYMSDKVKSRSGFQGCLAALDLDGDIYNVFDHNVNIEDQYLALIEHGCKGPTKECTPLSCKRGGECIQEWETFTCNCDMTSYTGRTCTQDGATYRYDGPAVITFTPTAEERRDTSSDVLAFGFQTDQRDAVLLHVCSGNSNDYLEIELHNGVLYAVYNMGTEDHSVGQELQKVNDGAYHIVRFVRSGPNATLQTDDGRVLSLHPRGHQHDIFNQQAKVFIGGKKDSTGRIMRPFTGVISGLVLNKMPLLENAEIGDQRIKVEGEVYFDIPEPVTTTFGSSTSPPIRTTLHQTPSSTQLAKDINTTERDESLVSGKALGSQNENSAECHNKDTSEGLITPQAKLSTMIIPHVTQPPFETGEEEERSGCSDDDEDCTFGSGSNQMESNEFITHSSPDFTFTEVIGNDTHPIGKETTTSVEVESTRSKELQGSIGDKNIEEPRRSITYSTLYDNVNSNTGKNALNQGNNISATPPYMQEVSQPGNFISINIWLIVGIALGVVLLFLLLAYAIHKYRRRDEGTYKIDDTKNYRYETVNTKIPLYANGSGGVNKSQTAGNKTAKKKASVKEWYV